MKKVSKKLREILRNVFVLLGIAAVPYAAHAMYGMYDPGPRDTNIHGTVSSLETGESIPGIRVNVTGEDLLRDYYTNTDDDGYFSLLLPERESYYIHFTDTDGEFNGGFFRHKTETVTLSGVSDALNVRLEGESDVTLRGVVRSAKNGEGISRVRLLINITETDINYRGYTDDNGNFFIRVPERDSYYVRFEDVNSALFVRKDAEFTLTDTNGYLNIVMEEEKIINLRGVVRSANKGTPLDQIELRFFSDTGIQSSPYERTHIVFTDDDGYFEIKIPERERYSILFSDPSRRLSIGDSLNITLPYDNSILSIIVNDR